MAKRSGKSQPQETPATEVAESKRVEELVAVIADLRLKLKVAEGRAEKAEQNVAAAERRVIAADRRAEDAYAMLGEEIPASAPADDQAETAHLAQIATDIAEAEKRLSALRGASVNVQQAIDQARGELTRLTSEKKQADGELRRVTRETAEATRDQRHQLAEGEARLAELKKQEADAARVLEHLLEGAKNFEDVHVGDCGCQILRLKGPDCERNSMIVTIRECCSLSVH